MRIYRSNERSADSIEEDHQWLLNSESYNRNYLCPVEETDRMKAYKAAIDLLKVLEESGGTHPINYQKTFLEKIISICALLFRGKIV